MSKSILYFSNMNLLLLTTFLASLACATLGAPTEDASFVVTSTETSAEEPSKEVLPLTDFPKMFSLKCLRL